MLLTVWDLDQRLRLRDRLLTLLQVHVQTDQTVWKCCKPKDYKSVPCSLYIPFEVILQVLNNITIMI